MNLGHLLTSLAFLGKLNALTGKKGKGIPWVSYTLWIMP